MKNYAEELAYWYFRFNGFFLINNYVTHRRRAENVPENPDNRQAHLESDILGIRPPHVNEEIGYPIHSCGTLNGFINPIATTTGIICEVKGGDRDQPNNNKLLSQVKRIGLFHNYEQVAHHLNENAFYFDPASGRLIIKVLVRRREDEEHSWNILRFDQIIGFLNGRFDEYEGLKERGWDKYNSSLLQYLMTIHQNV